MSSTPTKQIDGDVSVGRHVSVGGKATVRGNVTIDHDVIIKGWLDAPNIKGPNKGLFSTPDDLKAAYPSGKPGWWVVVGKTFPAAIYVCNGIEWIPTGEMWNGPDMPLESFTSSITELEGDIEELYDYVEGFGADVDNAKLDINELDGKIKLLTPVRCADEAELLAKAASEEYPVGQQFYIPEND